MNLQRQGGKWRGLQSEWRGDLISNPVSGGRQFSPFLSAPHTLYQLYETGTRGTANPA